MKKGLFIIIAAIICFGGYIIYTNKTSDKKETTPEQPLKISKNSAVFNNSLQYSLNAYYQLHDALVNWDSSKIVQNHADSLAEAVNKIPFEQLKADSTLIVTAKQLSSSIVAEVSAMRSDTSIKDQRKDFYTITENLYNLLRTVQYDVSTIYHVKCPMAFNGDEEGYWLSAKAEIINPYYGNKDPQYHSGMMHCGSIEDSISFK